MNIKIFGFFVEIYLVIKKENTMFIARKINMKL